MKTNQPAWHCIANLGDANPAEHGGEFIMIDRRGLYCPEMWKVESDDDGKKNRATLYRFSLDLCTRCPSNENALSDNRFHADSPAWFGGEESLKDVARFVGQSDYQLREALSDSDPIARAYVYSALFAYYGGENFDSSPDEMTAVETRKLCRKLLSQCTAADKWKDGLA